MNTERFKTIRNAIIVLGVIIIFGFLFKGKVRENENWRSQYTYSIYIHTSGWDGYSHYIYCDDYKIEGKQLKTYYNEQMTNDIYISDETIVDVEKIKTHKSCMQ